MTLPYPFIAAIQWPGSILVECQTLIMVIPGGTQWN